MESWLKLLIAIVILMFILSLVLKLVKLAIPILIVLGLLYYFGVIGKRRR